jgi:hypothetical protein
MAKILISDGIRKAIETCERYQRGFDYSDVRVSNLRIGKTIVSADVRVIDADGYARKRRNKYDIISL